MVREQYPYIDENEVKHGNLIRHYSDDNKTILQVETGIEYDEAIDVYPCRYTYKETKNPLEVIEDADK